MNEVRVGVAEWAVAGRDAVLLCVGLGSCVAIAMYDAAAQIGGLAHVLLPSESLARDRRNRAKFAGSAVPLLVEQILSAGASERRVCAKIVGGSRMFAPVHGGTSLQIGERNVLATLAALEEAGILLVAQDVGGEHGRSVFFHVSDGRLVVRSLTGQARVL